MKITRLYTGTDRVSHFEDAEITLHDAGDIGQLPELIKAAGIVFRETAPDYDYRWHNAPPCRYIMMLDGAVNVETGVGTVRRFGAGDMSLAEDTGGRGHISRAVDGQPENKFLCRVLSGLKYSLCRLPSG